MTRPRAIGRWRRSARVRRTAQAGLGGVRTAVREEAIELGRRQRRPSNSNDFRAAIEPPILFMGWSSEESKIIGPKPHTLLQLRVFRFGSDKNGDVRVGVFPQCQEI